MGARRPARGRLALAAIAIGIVSAHAVSSARQETPSRAAEAYRRAGELEARGDVAGALSLLWTAAGLAPADADIQNRLGEALERVGALDAALDAYRAAVAARPSFRKASNNLILALVAAGRGPEAATRARAEVAAAPDDADRLFTLGLALSEQDVVGATESFRRVLALAPGHVLARYNLALVLKRVDRSDEAIAELRRVVAIEPRPEAYHSLGLLYWQRNDLAPASEALRAAIAGRPDQAAAHHALGAVLAAQGDRAGAIAALRRAIVLQPDLAGAHDTLARVLSTAGEVAAARPHFEEAERLRRRERGEREARVWTSLGTERLEGGRLTEALDCFTRAIDAFDAYAPAHFQAGRTLQRLGRDEAARAAFARARRLNPNLVPPDTPP